MPPHSSIYKKIIGNAYAEYPTALDNPWIIQYNILANGVWRSLVSRLVRVQEASGSNPDTPTIKESPPIEVGFLLFFNDYKHYLRQLILLSTTASSHFILSQYTKTCYTIFMCTYIEF